MGCSTPKLRNSNTGYVAGYGISSESRDYPVVVLDYAQSPASRGLVSRLNPPYFKLTTAVHSDAEWSRRWMPVGKPASAREADASR